MSLSSMAAMTVALVLVALVFGSGLLARQPVVHGQRSFQRARTSARRMFTGSDGSVTGTASFQGNFTSITQPQQSYFVIERESDCSLTLHTGKQSTLGSVTVTGNTPHYEGVLHKLASLKTSYDAYPKGCVEKNTGLSSRPVVHVGISNAGNYIFAAAKSVITGTVSDDYSTYSFTSNRSALPYATGIATADLNGDGFGDLVVVNSALGVANAYVAVMLGNADGTFKAPVSYPTAGAASIAATIDDVNDDGIPDLIVASDDQQISILLGKGDGTFSAATNFAAPLPGSTTPSSTPILALITADLRGIGKKDIICSNGLVLLGKGDGTFAPVTTAAFPFTQNPSSGVPPGIASGDLNNDGKIDLVVGNGTTVSTWLGKGDGTFAVGNEYASIGNSGYVTVTDLDGDGNADIYTGLANGGFYSGDFSNAAAAYVLMGNGDGTFQGAPALNSGAYSGNNLADLNGDGVPDLISNTVSNSGGTSAAFTVALGNDKGTFTPVSSITAPDTFTLNGYKFTGVSKAGATSYAVADVNGDDKADLVFVDNGLTAINSGSSIPITYPYPVYFVALGNGDGTFQAPVPHAFPQIAPAPGFDNTLTATGLQIGDFNRDSHADLIFTYNDIAGGTGVNPYLQGLVVLTGAGNGTFSTTPILTSTYSSTTAPTTALVPQIVTVADLNGDNNPDLIVNAPGTTIVNFQLQTQLQVYLSNGDGTFKTPTTIAIGADAYGLPVLADFNKDGKLDLATLAETSAGQAELAVSLGNGDGTFAAAAISNLLGGDTIRSAGLAGADFDDDGNIDLALFDSADFSGIFYGKGDGTFTSVPSNGNIVPKDLINVLAGEPAVAVDLNKDGKPDILAGSVSLLNIYGSAPVVTGATATATTLSASATTIAVGSSVTFTAQVTPSGSGTPTGTVTFLNGTSSLGTGALNSSGKATFSTSSLAAGSYSVTAAYGGDATFAASTSSAVALTVTGVGAKPDFALAASPATLTIAAGKSGTDTISATPMNGFNQPISFACSGLPSGAACNFSPASVTPSGTAASSSTMTISTTAASSRDLNPWPFAGGGIAFALCVFFVRDRRRLPNLLGVMLLLLGIGGIASACGGSSSKTPGTPAGTSTVTVTATSGTGASALSHTTTLSLTIQ